VHQRERLRLLRGMREVQGLMQLLMKQRNGYRWTKEERRQIRSELRRFVLLSPYLVLFFMPGGFFALPLLAWWLDRRRVKRTVEADANVVSGK